MKQTEKIILLVLAVSVATGCASAGKKFGKIYPGMRKEDVVKTMEKGPSEVQQFSDGYTAWYYGEDRCLLMKEDEVASKAETKTKTGLEIPGILDGREKVLAECLPPGQAPKNKVQREIETPFGSLKR